jgi:drug/metabolite transporter (DMT)-like permease
MRPRKLALTEGVTAGAFFGTAAIFIRILSSMDAFSIAFWRLIIASAALGTILVALGKSFSFDLVKKNVKDILTLSFFLSLHFIFFISAVKDTTILNATVLVNTTPIFSMLVSNFIFKVKPSRLAILGLTISFVGVGIIAYAETIMANTSLGISSPTLKGDLEAVLAALVESFYLNYGKKIRYQMNILSTMFPIYVLTAVFVGVLSIPATNGALTLPTGLTVFIPLLGLGILPTAIAHTLYFSSLSDLKSFETATMALLEPIGATLLGIFAFKEIPVYPFVLGAASILIGIIFVAKETG